MGWPQIAFIVLLAVEAGMALAKDGEPKGNWSFGWQCVSVAIVVWLLVAGGFFA